MSPKTKVVVELSQLYHPSRTIARLDSFSARRACAASWRAVSQRTSNKGFVLREHCLCWKNTGISKTFKDDLTDGGSIHEKKSRGEVQRGAPNGAVKRNYITDLLNIRDEHVETQVGEVVEDDSIVEFGGNASEVECV